MRKCVNRYLNDEMKRFFNIYLPIIILLLVGCTRDDGTVSPNQPATDSMPNDIDNISGENLILNNGVEKWEMDLCEYPENWLLPHGYCNKVTRNNSIVFEGKYSAKMKSPESGVTARIAQLIKVTPGCKIRIRFNYYVEKWKSNGARTYCYFRTGPQGSVSISIAGLRSIYSNDEYYVFRGGGYGKAYLPHTENTWLVFDETLTVPQDATHFEFGINSYYGTTIYVDECYIGEYKNM